MADTLSLLPPNATALERAGEAVSAARWDALDIDVIRRAKDPETCPEDLLGFLAFERSVDIWDPSWPVWKKRAVIASAPRDHRLKGTEAGLRRYVDIADGTVAQLVVAPGGVFASRNLTREEWDALVARHPRLRITLARRRGVYQAGVGIVAGASFAGNAFAAPDRTRALLGRRAVLEQGGATRELEVRSIGAGSFERVVVPGRSGDALFAGAGFVGRAFAGAEAQSPRFHSFRLPRGYRHAESALQLSTLSDGLSPREPRYRRESERGQRGVALFLGTCACANFVLPDRGGDLLADILHLHDPAVAVPQVAALSFVGHARVGIPHHQAEVLVDWRRKLRPGTAFIVGRSFVGHDPVGAEDRSVRDTLLGAIARSARASDRLKVSFQTHRSRRLGDGLRLDGRAPLGASVPNRL